MKVGDGKPVTRAKIVNLAEKHVSVGNVGALPFRVDRPTLGFDARVRAFLI